MELFNYNRNLSETPVRDRPVLRQGNNGEWVSELQKELAQLTFYNGPINGNFYGTTNAAVRSFQQNNRLTVDGIVGINTWSSLIFLYSPLAICGDSSAPEGGTSTYTVVTGDTLFSLAKRFNTTVSELMSLNNLSNTGLSIGQVLRIPATSVNPPVQPPSTNHPTIRQGNTGEAVRELQILLTNLGYNTGSTSGIFGPMTDAAVRLFQRNNNLSIDGVVGPITWGALINTTTPPPPDGNNTYQVVAGDTLWSIARKFNTTVDAIVKLNNLTGTNLSLGQQLLIPNSTAHRSHVVVPGDTLFSIARRYDTTVSAIMQLNNMTSNILRIGQQLLIP